MGKRQAKIERKTTEVSARIDISLDGSGKFDIDTGIAFFNHMLAQLAKHGYFDLKIKAIGDIDIDFHHTVEDVGLALGEAIFEALGDKRSITRFGEAFVPFDETLAFACVDLSGRPQFEFRVEIPKSKVGEFDVELAEEFFKSLIIEAMFKAVGRALDKATTLDPRSRDIPSTKGKL